MRVAASGVLITLAFGLSACGGGGGSGPTGIVPTTENASQVIARIKGAAPRPNRNGKIRHVVIIVQENRSFDDLFQGYKGADTQSYGYTSAGQKIKLKPIGLEAPWDIDHSSTSFFQACDGQGSLPGTNCKMDGFNKEFVGCGNSYEPKCPYSPPEYAYVPRTESQPYFDMAKQFVLGDRMFTSELDASSFVSHQYIIGAQANSAVNYPTGQWGCDGGPSDTIHILTQQRQIGGSVQACFDSVTLGDELDQAGLPWGYYTADLHGDGNIWSAYQAISHIRYGPDWNKDVVSPQTKFFDVISGGTLPAVSWVTPTCANSDHAGCGSNSGPAWVTSLVNAIGESPYWNSTAIFIMWDEYGGWYDHVPPPMEDYDGLGIRVPLLIISPYAKKHYVSHVQYEHGSILKFVEDTFGLPRMAASDTRANSPADDAFNFSRKPRKFVPISAKLKKADILRQPPDHRIPDAQ
ncbi:MAG TPA: alkaline phosphatase family protein [Candidatus Tumulicola sp.]|jgi:phospholipase C